MFVQVHVRTNMSDPFPEKIVRERLDGAIRTLRGEIALYRLLGGGRIPFRVGLAAFRHPHSTGRDCLIQFIVEW